MRTTTNVPPRTRRRRLVAAGVLTAATATAAACALTTPTAQASGTAAGPVQTSISWGACPPAASDVKRDPRETCGIVTVPLDYTHSQGKTISVEVSRIATAKPGRKRGDLLFNPGGPGLEGLDMNSQMESTLPPSVLDEYDLIGFDPRGVGHSTPVSCGLTDPSFLAVFPYPGAGGSIRDNVATARTVARQCGTVGDLQYFNTANTARDIDRIRQALDVPKISYWGQSFGTYIGAVYTSLFPQHTDRMVLEGDVDPDKVWAQQLQTWNQGMNDRFPDAARVAAADNAELGLGSTVTQVTDTFLTLADHLDSNPAAVPGTSAAISGGLLRAETYQLLLHNEKLTPLTRFWKAAADLSAGKPLTPTDTVVLQQLLSDSGSDPGVPADNQVSITLADLCGDVSWSHDVASYAKATAAARARYPLSAGMPDNIRPCAFWSKAPIEPPVRVTSHGPRDILILQNRRDNATPWASGLRMRRALGSRAGFVGVDNGGHYVYGTGSTCADQATVAFLANGTLPAKDEYCAGPTS
jgi:pimeloyl-ACP methyl ester carboxylesterase